MDQGTDAEDTIPRHESYPTAERQESAEDSAAYQEAAGQGQQEVGSTAGRVRL